MGEYWHVGSQLDISDNGNNHHHYHSASIQLFKHHTLLPVFGGEHVSEILLFTDTLNTFTRFYVNKYTDHHAFEIAFLILLILLEVLTYVL